tara:strand:+ start:1401 stop:1937 length:537 start_codon:yes stop_codon:yes gene_type:complete
MATRKTSPFVLSTTVQLTAVNQTGTANIDLGSYVDVSSKTGLAIHAVDAIFQTWDSAANAVDSPEALSTAAWWANVQVFDQTRSELQIANDNSLVGSAALEYDGSYLTSYMNDVYPDSYPAPGRLTISPQLTVVARNSGAAFDTNKNQYITVRITGELVKLSEKDWMGIAIQGQALNS